MLSGYDKIVFLDTPPGYGLARYLSKKTKAKIYIPKSDNQSVFYDGIDCSREAFGEYFSSIRKNQNLVADNILAYYKLLSARVKLNMNMFIASVAVFNELGFITVHKSPFSITVNDGVKKELSNSDIYCFLRDKTSGQ